MPAMFSTARQGPPGAPSSTRRRDSVTCGRHGLEPGPAVAARVEDEAVSPDTSCQVQMIGQRLDPLLHYVGLVGAKVDQVYGVHEHRPHTGVGHVLPESLNLGVGNVPEGPGLRR